MYKLIAIDLDGTMLNSYGVITEKTKETVKKAIEKGIEVIIASGRTIDSIKNFAKEINSENYLIAGNGAILYDIKNDEILYENCLKKEKVLEIIKICEENSIFYNVYTEKEIITQNLNYNVLYYYKENLKKEEEKKTHIKIVENIYDYIKKSEKDSYLKVMICDETKIIFNSILRKLNYIDNVEILDVEHMSRKIIKQGTEEFNIEYFYTEVSAKNVDKWFAIEKIIEKLKIKKEEVIAIGDNINDKKMIENAGIGVAMEGSTPVITEIANFVTDSNNSDGVEKAILKFI